MANNGKFINIDNATGRMKEDIAIDASTGVADACKVLKTDAAGRIDPSFMPVGIGADVKVLPSTENLAAGDYVNIFDNGGTLSVRLADNSNNRPAHGFVNAAVTSPANATILFEGENSNLSGLTPGARYYLDTVGQPTSTVPTGAVLFQFLGVAVSATGINTDITDAIERC